MYNKILKSKKAAIELSIGTIVVIVIAMTMLILGLVLVRNIFANATESVGELDDKVREEITKLFTDESTYVIVKLGSGQTAKIKQGTDSFSLAIGARTKDGSSTNRQRLTYKLSLEKESDNCIKRIGLAATKALFITPLDKALQFDKYDGADSFARVQLRIPKGTAICTQKVNLDVEDTQSNNHPGGSFFIIEIIKSGFF